MATIVCQGPQSCLESQLVESRTLRLRLSSPKPYFSQSLELSLKQCPSLDSNTSQRRCDEDHMKSSMQNPHRAGWSSFFQVLSNTCAGTKESMEKEKETTYVHPLVKRYPSTLSEKSLELCTENLGSETGSDIIEDTIFALSSSSSSSSSSFSSSVSLMEESEVGNSPTGEKEKPRQLLLGAKKGNNSNNNSHTFRCFPPPLTTMSGSESLQVRPHREDGRLIIKAVKAPLKHTYFQAERSHGRLRLCFVKDSASNFDYVEKEAKHEEANQNDVVNYDGEEEETEEDYFEEEEEEYDDDDDDDDDAEEEEEEEEEKLSIGPEMGMEEFQRPSRCKEGELENKGLLNWEPLWVATS